MKISRFSKVSVAGGTEAGGDSFEAADCAMADRGIRQNNAIVAACRNACLSNYNIHLMCKRRTAHATVPRNFKRDDSTARVSTRTSEPNRTICEDVECLGDRRGAGWMRR